MLVGDFGRNVRQKSVRAHDHFGNKYEATILKRQSNGEKIFAFRSSVSSHVNEHLLLMYCSTHHGNPCANELH